MARIAISYRRSDSQDITGRIFDRLVDQYGRDTVFRDIDSIRPGTDYRKQITHALEATDILVVVLGPKWLGHVAGESRIDNEADPVRIEVETALKRDIQIIPVLVSGMQMPAARELPDGLKDLVYRQAVTVDSGRDFDHHIDGLISTLDEFFESLSGAPQTADSARPRPSILTAKAMPFAARSKNVPAPGPTAPTSKTQKWSRLAPAAYVMAGLLVGVAAVAGYSYFRGAAPPSFDCHGDLNSVEGAICRSPDLSELDRDLSEAYAVLRAHLDKDRQAALVADENAWQKIRNACATDACIHSAYTNRLRELKNWQ
jgi:uncharacterized protein YecT (DUF1311 family)